MVGFTSLNFIKWAGSKRNLVQTFEKRQFYPNNFKRFFEPMLGAGYVFFNIAQKYNNVPCFLSDINPDLIDTWDTVKNNIDNFIKELKLIKEDFQRSKDKKTFFEDTRIIFNIMKNKKNPNYAKKAAFFLFLNKTCYNGLYRVNSNGEFNVPYGKYKNPKIFDEKNLRNISDLLNLRKTILYTADFEEGVKWAKKNDFVYFDPPYAPISKTSDFTSYTKKNFTLADQKRLAKTVDDLTQKGCYVMESNSSSPEILDIYNKYEYLNIYSVKASRYISCKADGRKPV